MRNRLRPGGRRVPSSEGETEVRGDERDRIKQVLARYYKSNMEYYSKLVEVFGDGRNLKVKFIDIVALASRAERILDAGSGSGLLAIFLKERFPQKEIHGVDLSPIGIEMAKRRAGERKLEVRWQLVDLEDGLPYSDSSFDLIICHEVLEHLTRPADAIRNMARTLKRGGKLVVISPNLLIRAPLRVKIRKALEIPVMLIDRDYLQPSFFEPHFRWVGGDADATYVTNPFELHRMAKCAGLRLSKKSFLRCLLIAEKI